MSTVIGPLAPTPRMIKTVYPRLKEYFRKEELGGKKLQEQHVYYVYHSCLAVVDPRLPMLSWLLVPEKDRGKGYGGYMVEYLKKVYPNILAEVSNPLVHTDDKDAERRLRFYANHGFKIINPDYVQPSLGKNLDAVDGMFLMAPG